MNETKATLAVVLALALWTPAIAASSQRPGIGAIPYADAAGSGTTFRTWAPNATAVHVAGTFNLWSTTSIPLFAEGNGFWSVDVATAQVGAQYKFVVRNGTQTLWKNDPRARDLTNSAGNSVIYSPAAYQWQVPDFTIPSWDRIVCYEMHVGTYGTPASGATPSSFAECAARLDHLQELGVNMVALMPTCEFPGDRSWGYNYSHPYAVESAYGSPDDLKAFVDAAHARGIAVTIDIVFNHLGPTDLDMWVFDGWSQNSLGGIFFYNDFRSYTPWGNTRPDYGRGEVRSFIRDNAMMWLEEFRADGIRFDGTKYIRKTDQFGTELPEGWSLMQWINNDIDAAHPEKFIVAEDMDVNDWITKTTGAGGAGFDSQWDASFFPRIRAACVAANDADRDMNQVRDAIAFSYNGSMQQRIIYTESHDEVANGRQRVPEEISPGNAGSWWARKRSTLGAVAVMTAPGVPLLFEGQEFLEDEFFRDDVPLDWSRKLAYPGIFSLYKDLVALRTNAAGVTRGLSGFSTNVFHVNNTEKVVAFHRWQEGGDLDDTIVVLNFSGTPKLNYRIGMPRPGMWRSRFNSDWNGYSSDYANTLAVDTATEAGTYDGLGQSALISVGAYSAVIYSQGSPPPPPNPADINHDGMVDGFDMTILLSAWGSAGGDADVDHSGIVDGLDMTVVLSAWSH